MSDINYTAINSETIDRWVDDGWEWSVPIDHETYVSAQAGDWGVLLTPKIPVPHTWFEPCLKGGRLDGTRLLGLASGGGQQMPIFSALGARCTVLDYSQKQLDHEKMVAEREGYDIDIVKADMTLRLPFDDAVFDMIFHPVSNCYIEDVRHVWRECFRVLKPGGVLLAGFDNGGISYLFDDSEKEPLIVKNKLPFNPLKNPDYMELLKRDDAGVQFSHSLEEQIGGQLEAGLTLTHLFEDSYDSGLGLYCPLFMATRAVKRG